MTEPYGWKTSLMAGQNSRLKFLQKSHIYPSSKMNNAEILIIDDEVQIRKLLEITLQSNGYKINEAGTAKDGLITAANHPPDLIILDLGLPDESGHEVLRKLREWYSKPVIILSVQS